MVWPAHREFPTTLGSGKTASALAALTHFIHNTSWADMNAPLQDNGQGEEGTLEGWEEAYAPDADSDPFDE
ncbi:hypothetical protein ACWD0A_34255 [Streptomyces sp. NPDC002867]